MKAVAPLAGTRGQTGAVAKAAENRAREAAEQADRDRKNYGKAMPAVQFLRSRGFGVTAERGEIIVGNAAKTKDEVWEMARRHGMPNVDPAKTRKTIETAGGLKIGAVVPLKPKASPGADRPLSGAAAAAVAKASVTSDDLGPEPRLDWIGLDHLTVDGRYQRAMGKENWAHVARITREWNWLHYQPIVVAPFDSGDPSTGLYVVIDGQHRLEAARKHPRIDKLPCYIVAAADVAAQARAFVALNARRIGVTRLQRYWASHAAGDPMALRIARICDKAGVTITRSGGALPPRTTFATFTLEKLLPLGIGTLTTALGTLAAAHPTTPDVFKSPIIFALAQLVATPQQSFDQVRAVKVIAGDGLANLMAAAKSRRAVDGGTLERTTEKLLREKYGRAR